MIITVDPAKEPVQVISDDEVPERRLEPMQIDTDDDDETPSWFQDVPMLDTLPEAAHEPTVPAHDNDTVPVLDTLTMPPPQTFDGGPEPRSRYGLQFLPDPDETQVYWGDFTIQYIQR